MKYISIVIIGSLILFALLVSCSEKAEYGEPKPTVSPDEVKRKLEEAAEVTRDYLVQQSWEYRKELETKLEELDQQLEKLYPKLKEAEATTRERLQKELENLEKQRQLLQQKLEELKEPTKQAWEDLKSGMDTAMSEMEKALKKAAEHFK